MQSVGLHICCLTIIVVLMFFSRRVKALKLYSSQIYRLTLLLGFLAVLTNIISIATLEYHELFPALLLIFIAKLYQVFVLAVACSSYVYIMTGTYSSNSHRLYEKIGLIFSIVYAVMVFLLPMHISHDRNMTYTYGLSVSFCYIAGFFTIIAIIVFILINYRQMSYQRFWAVLIWMLVWSAAAMVQFFIPDLPMTSFGVAMGLNIIYSALESPETYTDRETGVFNTYANTRIMQQYFNRDETFSLLIVDTDLSEKNLSYEAQSNVMINMAKELLTVRGAMVFRHTSNSFALVFTEIGKAEKALTQLDDYFGTPIVVGKQVLKLLPKYTLIPNSGVAGNEAELFLIQNYFSAQKNDSGLVTINEEMVAQLRNEQKVVTMILDALDNDRLEVFFQPIYSTDKKIFTSAEALARIRDESGSIVPPGIFIPVAEQSPELITRIGERVMEKTCRFIRKHNITEIGMEYIEVNLSVTQCSSPSLADDFLSIIADNGINPSLLSLEITESASIKSKQNLLSNMEKLHIHDIRFCLDDFGTGESNLNYVMTMPVDTIKFDRSLTVAYFENMKAKFVMDSVITMVKNMDMTIVAEGVETKEQFETIESLGIDYIQGFYFSRPLPENEFMEFIKKNNEK